MEIILSTVSNADLAAQAVLRQGAQPRFLCLQASRPVPVDAPVAFFDNARDYEAALRDALRQGMPRPVFFSTAASDAMQESDRQWRAVVESLGARFIGQDELAIAISSDKRRARALAADLGMPSARVPASAAEIEPDEHYVWKRVRGDGGKGQRILTGADLLSTSLLDRPDAAEHVLEAFVDGVEISMSVFAGRRNCRIAPLLVKGETSRDNLHAVDKVRGCYPGRFRLLEQMLTPFCRRFAQALNAFGWIDVEFVVTTQGVYFIEVNARFNGLSRLTYEATGINPYEIALAGEWEGDEATYRPAMELPIRQPEDFRQSTQEATYTQYPNPGLTLGKCTFGANSLDALHALCATLEPSPLKGRSVALAEEAAGKLDTFCDVLAVERVMPRYGNRLS